MLPSECVSSDKARLALLLVGVQTRSLRWLSKSASSSSVFRNAPSLFSGCFPRRYRGLSLLLAFEGSSLAFLILAIDFFFGAGLLFHPL